MEGIDSNSNHHNFKDGESKYVRRDAKGYRKKSKSRGHCFRIVCFTVGFKK